MRTAILFSKAIGLLNGLKPRTPAAVSNARAQPAKFSPLATEDLQQSLAGRISEHLSAYTDLQSVLKPGTRLDKLPESRRLIQDAKGLAAQIASIPGYCEFEPLCEAHRVLNEHWESSWSNGGVSPIAYRARLKGLILFIRSFRPMKDVSSVC